MAEINVCQKAFIVDSEDKYKCVLEKHYPYAHSLVHGAIMEHVEDEDFRYLIWADKSDDLSYDAMAYTKKLLFELEENKNKAVKCHLNNMDNTFLSLLIGKLSHTRYCMSSTFYCYLLYKQKKMIK